MKKHLAIIMAATMAFSAVPAFSASAAENVPSKDFVLFGDSIAAGYTRNDSVKYNYGQILADYYNGTVTNYAVSGDDSQQMLDKIKSLTDAEKKTVKDAECVVISVGGNDMINFLCHDLLVYLAEKGVLAEGYTAENVPERVDIEEFQKMADLNTIKKYANNLNNALDLNMRIQRCSRTLTVDKADNDSDGYIKNHIMANISESVKEIRAINPDAKIVVQTVYQPLQLDPAFVSKTFDSTYSMLINLIRGTFEEIMYTFSKELKKLAAADNFLVADVYQDITSEDPEEVTESMPGHAAYFVDISHASLSDADIHPNQKGHVAIAATIINTLDEKHNDNGLLSDLFENFSDKASYPAYALAIYESAAGTWTLGDVNFDNVIDARDATAALTAYAKASAGQEGLRYRENLAADVNEDKVLDGRDATFILTYYAKASAGKAGAFDEYIKTQK